MWFYLLLWLFFMLAMWHWGMTLAGDLWPDE